VAELLRQQFPDLLEGYRRVLFDKPARNAYLMELRRRVDGAAENLGLTGRVTACF
jgi:hypothetical protein